MALVWTAWKRAGTGSATDYGLKVPLPDREKLFEKWWQTVVLELPAGRGFTEVEVNVSKASFWTAKCHALISDEIGRWLHANGLVPWPTHRPPKLIVEQMSARTFRVKSVAN